MYWLIAVKGDVEPEVLGPWESVGEQILAAKKLRRAEEGYRAELTDEDGLFWLDIDAAGTPEVGSFDALLFEERED